MKRYYLRGIGAALLVLASAPPQLAAAATLKATLIVPAEDARLTRSRLERGYLGHPGGSAGDGVRVALQEAKIELEGGAANVVLDTLEVADAAAASAAAQRAEKAGAAALLTDLPAAWTLAVADAAPKLPVLNIGNASDNLREADCRKQLFHLLPSDRMRADALAQTLVARKWLNVLLLTGPTPQDAQRSAVAQAAIKRFGLKLVANKAFKLSADPRERDLANPALLSSASLGNYDAVWVVDSDGEFAAGLPYRTALPRPVVGDAGLVPLAWHDKFDRFGAPQVSRRLARATQPASRAMTAQDWAAWMAGKALVAAALAAPKQTVAQVLATAELDGSKGVTMSFRPWDGQLRQPLLLSDGQSVIAMAPVDGMLHPKNSLDTLGADAPEKLCKARQ